MDVSYSLYFLHYINGRTEYQITVFPAPGIPKQQKTRPLSAIVSLSRHLLKDSSLRSHVPAFSVRGNLTSWCRLSGSNGVNIVNSWSILTSAGVSLTHMVKEGLTVPLMSLRIFSVALCISVYRVLSESLSRYIQMKYY